MGKASVHKMKKKKRLSKTQIILIIGFICILLAIGIVAFLILHKDDSEGNLVIDDSNLEDVESQLSETVKDGMFEVNMNTTWNFPNGTSASSDAYVANGDANTHPISFEVLLDGTDVIYSSTVIPVGKQIKEIILDKDLPAGTYQAVCMYHLLNEDGTESSSCGINISLNIAG